MRRLLALICIAIAIAANYVSAADQAESGGIESLGNELLDGLTPGELKNAAPSPDNSNPLRRNGDAPIQTPRFDDLGEDIGQSAGGLSLARVRHGMQQAESLLGAPGADAGTMHQADAVQNQVVDQLDKLIAELSKQCQGGQCQQSSSQPKPSQRAGKKRGKPKSAAGRGQTAARDSSDRLDQSNVQAADKGEIEAMVKELWGHLPERSREQMMQSFSEEFLPKYELEIEQYYRRLSENDGNLGTD
jgi:hypothetical protein